MQAEREHRDKLNEAKVGLENDLARVMNDLRALQEFMLPGVSSNTYDLCTPIAKDVIDRIAILKKKEAELEELWQSNTLMKHNNEHI